MKPEAIIELRFKTTMEGGRNGPVYGDKFRCPSVIDNEYFDCCLLLNGRQLDLGQVYQVSVLFLSPHLVLPKLSVGKSIALWEGKEIATGKVIELPDPAETDDDQ